MRREDLFGLPMTPLPDIATAMRLVDQALASRSGLIVTFVNPYAWRIGRARPDWAQMLGRFDLVLPDGIGVVKALDWARGIRAARLSFDASSLYLPVFDRLDRQRRRLFVIGAAPGVAERALARMRAEFPDIVVAGCLDGFRPQGEAVAAVLAAAPDLVLCGMGAPHQEGLLLELRARGFAGIGFTCGGFLDQLAEKQRYYPAWVDKADLRWLYRLCREPRRLLRRYTLDYAPFVAAALLALARRRLGVGRAAAQP
ncbi:MAG TPA: WecB/TagA/CpsF family glycosyltransferase [Geminicoccaceae bacterium]|nr:WecB/TagA/CpsF family glycosyltransferase [Geminicoccus sp.]HMU50765.1 WecB/TagA/CpsF family glycosyltransferase [Geminicoccaceae bacterium]